MAPTLNSFIMAIDAGLAYLGAAGISAGAQYFTNVSNANLNKNNRDWQERINRESREYNLPVNQKRRLEEAGINPYSVMTGETSATLGASNAEGTSAPSAIPYENPLPNNVALDLIQGMKLLSEKKGQDIANEQASMNLAFSETEKFLGIRKTMAEIKNLLSTEDLNRMERDYLEQQLFVYQQQALSILKRSRAEANSAEIMSNNLQREYDDRHNESLANQAVQKANVRVSKAQIQQIGAMIGKIAYEIQLLNKQGQLTDEQIEHEISKRLNTEENTRVLSARNERELISLRKEVAKELYDMLYRSETQNLGVLGTWHGADIDDSGFIGDDMSDFIMNGNIPKRSNNVNRHYKRNHNKSGIR